MKTSIWKYQLEITDKQELSIPEGSKILSVQTQKDCPCIWALVNPAKEKETRVFNIYGTGHLRLINTDEYVGTFQVANGALVFHLFEEKVNDSPKKP